MDETIEMPGRLLNRLPHIIFAVQIEDVCDEVESMLIVMDFGLQPSEVEAIS